jgi:hypothetical protein
VTVRNVAAGEPRFDLSLTREPGVLSITVESRAAAAGSGPFQLILSPAFPLDARVRTVAVDGRETTFKLDRRGDVQHAVVSVPATALSPVSPPGTPPGVASARSIGARVVFSYDEGTDVLAPVEIPARGATSGGLRILRSRADGGVLHLTREALAGSSYALSVRSPRAVGETAGVTVLSAAPSGPATSPVTSGSSGLGPRHTELRVAFDGPTGEYVRRTLDLPLR